MNLDAIDRPPSLVEKVCQRLADLARACTPEESFLPTERVLAAQFGVSRSVVREATKRLEQQGLLEIRQGLGIRPVNRLHKPLSDSLHLLVPDDMERLRQLLELRLIVEPENARFAAERATAAQLDALRAAHQHLVQASTPADSVAADMAFHRLLAAASGNQISALLLHSLSDLLEASLNHGYQRVTPALAIRQHAIILAAIERHDGAAAARATTRHLLSARTDLGL
jgi:GntR family transcriptional repressor for pyruvate dehydrogenase complex